MSERKRERGRQVSQVSQVSSFSAEAVCLRKEEEFICLSLICLSILLVPPPNIRDFLSLITRLNISTWIYLHLFIIPQTTLNLLSNLFLESIKV